MSHDVHLMKIINTDTDTSVQIGFVGREDGMTDRQKESLHIELARCVSQFKIDKRFFHCASCCGAAYEAYFIAKKLEYNIGNRFILNVIDHILDDLRSL